jgi:hypothetical protein
MKMKLSAIFIALMAFSQSASAETGVLLGYNIWSPAVSTTIAGASVSSASKGDFLAGLSYTTSLTPFFSLEIDGLYVTRKSDTTVSILGSSSTGVTSQNVIEVPILFRVHLLPMVNLGVGPYFAYGVGDFTSSGTSQSYQAASTSRTDYGAEASAQIKFPIAPGIHVSAEGRYVLGLKEESTNSSTSAKNREIQVLAGLTFGL